MTPSQATAVLTSLRDAVQNATDEDIARLREEMKRTIDATRNVVPKRADESTQA